MCEKGFVKANSNNLPKIDMFMVFEFLRSDDRFNAPEIRCAKAALQHLAAITSTLKAALESASWTTKAQGANAVSTVALKLGSTIDEEARNSLLTILTNGLQGRTWNGKERLVQALATLACNSKEALSSNPQLTDTVLDALYKESKKESVEYRRHAVKCFADVLHALGVDRFTQLYDIAQEILIKLSNKKDDDDDAEHGATIESTKRREDKLKLQETVYEALGKAWPSSNDSKATQGISKYTRIRKEALNIILSLSKKLVETENAIHLENLTTFFKELLPELSQDNQPEVRTRVVDIKGTLKL